MDKLYKTYINLSGCGFDDYLPEHYKGVPILLEEPIVYYTDRR